MKMLKHFVVLFLGFFITISTTVLGRNTNGHIFQKLIPENEEIKAPNKNYISTDISYMYKIYQQCSKEDVLFCLKVKLLAGLENIDRYPQEIQFSEGIKFTTTDLQQKITESNKMPRRTESDILAILPRSHDSRDDSLNKMILEKGLSFLEGHTLQVKFPSFNDIQQSLEESRGKKDKKSGAFIMIPLLLLGTFLPIAYGALALLAGKALIVSKLALVLASIIGIKKLLSSNGKESQHEVVVSGGHGGGVGGGGGSSGWGREFDMAYKAYDPGFNDKMKST